MPIYKCARCGGSLTWEDQVNPDSPGEYLHDPNVEDIDENDLARCADGEYGYPAPSEFRGVESPAYEASPEEAALADQAWSEAGGSILRGDKVYRQLLAENEYYYPGLRPCKDAIEQARQRAEQD